MTRMMLQKGILSCAMLLQLTLTLTDAAEASGEEEVPLDQDVDKRYLAALAKNGRLAKIQMERLQDRMNVAAAAPPDSKVSWVKKPSDSVEKDSLDPDENVDKRYLGAFLSSRGHPTFSTPPPRPTLGVNGEESKEKRNIAALARMGWLTTARSYRSPRKPRRRQSDPGVKREDLFYGDSPSAKEDEKCLDEDDDDEEETSSVEKRNIAALARNGRLPPFRNNWPDYWTLKRNPAIRYSQGSWPSAPIILTPKQYTGSKRQHYIRSVKTQPKRCRKSVAETSFSPLDLVEYAEKRNVAALARKGVLPQRRNVAALARKGINTRSVATMARKGVLPPTAQRRNLASMARKGLLPSQKRNIASMARKGILPYQS